MNDKLLITKEVIKQKLQSLKNMGYEMTDDFVALLLAKYCVDIFPRLEKDYVLWPSRPKKTNRAKKQIKEEASSASPA